MSQFTRRVTLGLWPFILIRSLYMHIRFFSDKKRIQGYIRGSFCVSPEKCNLKYLAEPVIA